jgi:hypothetical protein
MLQDHFILIFISVLAGTLLGYVSRAVLGRSVNSVNHEDLAIRIVHNLQGLTFRGRDYTPYLLDSCFTDPEWDVITNQIFRVLQQQNGE